MFPLFMNVGLLWRESPIQYVAEIILNFSIASTLLLCQEVLQVEFAFPVSLQLTMDGNIFITWPSL